MSRRTAFRRVVTLTVLVASVLASYSCRRGDAQAGSALQRDARRAKANGHTTETVHYRWSAPESSLSDVAQKQSAVIATPYGQPTVVVGDELIFTWHTFHVFRVLSSRPLPSLSQSQCGTLPKRLDLGAQDIALQFIAGSARIEGVLMTMETPYSRVGLKPDTHYLLLGDRCPSGQLLLPHGPGDMLEIRSDGRLSHVGFGARFTPEIQQLGTINAFEAYLRNQ